MGDKKTGRGRLIVEALVLLVVIGGVLAFVGAKYGTSRVITVAIAIAGIAALVWLILMAVSLMSLGTARRTPSDEPNEPTNTQRAVPKRAPIITEREQDPGPGERRTGHRRKDS